jgi:anti-anti-sigma factor
MPEGTFEIQIQPGSNESVDVISVKGPMILENLFKFQSAWKAATAREGIVFDLTGVPYIDSSAIGSLVNAHVHFTNRGQKIALAGVSPRLKEFLRVTRVDSLFKFYDASGEAMQALSGRAATAS